MEKKPYLPPVSDQRTLFLVNAFVIQTVRLLNNFGVICEDKLADIHRRILRADATLSLLEAKVRSVDGLEGVGEQIAEDRQQPQTVALKPEDAQFFEIEQSASSHAGQSQSASSHAAPPVLELSGGDSAAVVPSVDESGLLKVKDDPMYARFFRMLQVGVPLPAVKIQMSLESLDGSLLDDPDAASPNS